MRDFENLMNPAALAVLTTRGMHEIVPRLEKDACDASGEITLESSIRFLCGQLLKKQAEHVHTLTGLESLKDLAGETNGSQ